jgi:hypothetical protein
MIKCQSCGKEMQDDLKFCQECGKPLEKKKNVCPNCNIELPNNSKFCGKCGFQVGQTQTPPVSPPPVSQSVNYNSATFWFKVLRICAVILIFIGFLLFFKYNESHDNRRTIDQNWALTIVLGFTGLGISTASVIIILISLFFDPKIFKSRARKNFNSNIFTFTAVFLVFAGGFLAFKFCNDPSNSVIVGFFGMGMILASVVFGILIVILKNLVFIKKIKPAYLMTAAAVLVVIIIIIAGNVYSNGIKCVCGGTGKVECDICNGTGLRIRDGEPCLICKGLGYRKCRVCLGSGRIVLRELIASKQ